MYIHPFHHDQRGAGRWERATGRYIPRSGGSRTRLPVYDDEDYPRYHGFVGIDEKLTPHIGTIAQLYHHMGGGVYMPPGEVGEFLQLLLNEAARQPLVVEEEDLAGTREEG